MVGPWKHLQDPGTLPYSTTQWVPGCQPVRCPVQSPSPPQTVLPLHLARVEQLQHHHFPVSNTMFAKGKLPLVRPEVHTPAHTPAQIGGKLCRGHPKICMALSN
eukprot:sb/3478097/